MTGPQRGWGGGGRLPSKDDQDKQLDEKVKKALGCEGELQNAQFLASAPLKPPNGSPENKNGIAETLMK